MLTIFRLWTHDIHKSLFEYYNQNIPYIISMDQPSKNIEIKTLKSFSSAPTANSGIFITFNPSHNET